MINYIHAIVEKKLLRRTGTQCLNNANFRALSKSDHDTYIYNR
jgi:hypothetical protein